MYIIHLYWHHQPKPYTNVGNLRLWIEHSTPIKRSKCYPYQMAPEYLSEWFADNFMPHSKPVKTNVYLPVNKDLKAIPSPVIANLNDIEDIVGDGFKEFSIHTIEVDCTIEFLKDLNFKSYHFEDNYQLGDDAKFWIKMAYELSHLIKKDQYIPCVVARKSGNSVNYYGKWQPISSAYNHRLSQIAKAMPYVSCLGDFVSYDTEAALHHFSEVEVTRLIGSTVFSQKNHKMVEGTYIEQCLDFKEFHLSEDVWKSWKLWKNNLSYDQFGAPFQVCFRLNASNDEDGEDWGIETLMQSKHDPSFMISLNQYWREKKEKSKLFSKMLGTSVDRTLLLQIGYASRIYPLLERLFEENMQVNEINITTEAAFQFLKEDAWSLHACGYHIIVPSWWTSKGRLKAKVKLKATKNKSGDGDKPTAYFSAEGLIKFNYQYAIGDHEVTPEEWQQLIQSKSELVYFRGAWVEIDLAEMQQMQKLIETSNKDKNIGSIKDLLMMSADDDLYEVEFDAEIEGMISGLQNRDKLEQLSSPDNLQATLRPYQERGLSWLTYLENLGMGSCLADDMGLGKTMQVIALLLKSPKDRSALLVAPTSVVGNWMREIQKFAPSLKCIVHHGAKRSKKEDFQKLVDNYDLIITSYGLVRKDKTLFSDISWSRLIIDEAQNIKNPSATQSKVLYKIQADNKIALTGTPIENRLMDLWSIFNFLNPGFLGTQAMFKKGFELPIQRDNAQHQTKVLKRLVEPFILRRLKTDKNIIQDLPDKVEQKVYCELTTEQASIYQSIVNEVEAQMKDSEELEGRSKHTIILSTLLRLKQCCNHPTQVLQDGSVFSTDRSAKLQRLIELVKEAVNNHESILIFSQFTEICEKLNTLLKTEHGITTYYLHGGTARQKREKMINEFQTPESPASVFILSLKAGGVGITLTKANHVIHFDRWWNPAVENQATDRAYRIGQKKTVFAHKFITMGTIEERIDQMLEDKQKVSDMIVGNDESWISKLDTKSFLKLIKLSKSSMEAVQEAEQQDEYAEDLVG